MKGALQAKLMHQAVRLGARAFGGAWGRIPPLAGPLPERLPVQAGEVTLDCLRWPALVATTPPATPLLLLHGLNNNAWIWARVADLLRHGRDVVAVTLRGHGRSSAPACGYALDRTTADLSVLLAQPGLLPGRLVLAGHSWGGKVACHLAGSLPGRVEGLILADPVLPQGLNGLLRRVPGLMLAAFQPERGPFPDRDALRAGANRLIYLRNGDELDRWIWEESFREQPDGSYRHSLPDAAFRELLLETLAEDITPKLASLDCPALLLRPTFTVSFLPGELGVLRRALPQLQERRVAGDHTFVHTNPLDTAREMGEFLAALPTSGIQCGPSSDRAREAGR